MLTNQSESVSNLAFEKTLEPTQKRQLLGVNILTHNANNLLKIPFTILSYKEI